MKKTYQKPTSSLVTYESVNIIAESGTGGTIPDAGWGAPEKGTRNPIENKNLFPF